MPAFQYIALDAKGKKKKGVLEADSARAVRAGLREQALVPVEVVLVTQRKPSSQQKKQSLFRTKHISASDLALITRQMSTLISAGIPLDDVLTGVSQQSEKSSVKSILLGVRARVLEGYALASAMDDFPKAFPRLYRTTILSGERSGKLDQVLTKLAEFTERQHQIKQKVRQALIYPSMMTIVSIAVVVFLLVYVVPKIVTVFTQTQQVLPLATQVLITLSNVMVHDGYYLLIAIVLMVWGFLHLLKRKRFRMGVDRLLLKLPVIGKAMRTVNGARFGRTFGILNAASVPVLESMQTASKLITPLPMREAVEVAIEQVREGSSIHQALQKTRFFAPMFVHLVASGEASGQLEAMLEKAASYQESDVEALIQGTLTLFEPMMILVMGGIVLFIVLAIMLPIFALDQFPSG